VTVRDRDTMQQDRIDVGALPAYLRERLEGPK
jgi:glycyl-tRNA synthetase (class II)